MTGQLRLPPHRASSVTLAGAYPFLATTPISRGVPVGTDALTGAAFCFDPWTAYADGLLTNPNVLLAGVIGQGKSALAKSLTLRSIAAGRRVHVPGDPKGEWAAVADAVGGQVVALGPGTGARLNPLDAAPHDPDGGGGGSRLRLVTALAETALARSLRPVEHTALTVALQAAAADRGVPTLPDLVTALTDPRSETAAAGEELRADGRELPHALRRLLHGDLAGMFDGPSTVRLNADAPMTVLDLSRLGSHDDAVALAMACGAAWLEAAIAATAGKRWVVYDEAWRLLGSLPLLRRMQAQWKLSRATGVANLMVLHRLSDLDAAGGQGSTARAVADGLLADCSTRIVYRQETDQLTATAAALGLTRPERELLPRLPRGTGLWKLPDRSWLVHHRLHVDELRIVDTDTAMRDTVPDGSGRAAP